jgi:hypothetical protein
MSRKKLANTAPFWTIRMVPLFSTINNLPDPSPQLVISTGCTNAGPDKLMGVKFSTGWAMPNVNNREKNKKQDVLFIANSLGGQFIIVQKERDGWDAMALNYAMKTNSPKV